MTKLRNELMKLREEVESFDDELCRNTIMFQELTEELEELEKIYRVDTVYISHRLYKELSRDLRKRLLKVINKKDIVQNQVGNVTDLLHNLGEIELCYELQEEIYFSSVGAPQNWDSLSMQQLQ